MTHARSLSPSIHSTLRRASVFALRVFIVDVTACANRYSARGRPCTVAPCSLLSGGERDTSDETRKAEIEEEEDKKR